MADPASDTQVSLQELGGFFVLVPAPDAGTGAVAWSEVLSRPTLAARFAAVRTALADSSGLPVEEVDPKVAVSAVQVGLASRLWSVALAGALLHGWVPDLSSDNLVATPQHGGTVPLGVRDPRAGYAVPRPASPAGPGAAQAGHRDGPALDLAGTAELLAHRVVLGPLADLETACAQVGRTPRRVLASNSTSTMVGGARVLAQQRPAFAATAWALARELLARPAVAPGGTAVDPGTLPDGVGGGMEHDGEAFLRSGCCVFYRLPGHGLCPDCVLAPSRAEQVTPAH